MDFTKGEILMGQLRLIAFASIPGGSAYRRPLPAQAISRSLQYLISPLVKSNQRFPSCGSSTRPGRAICGKSERGTVGFCLPGEFIGKSAKASPQRTQSADTEATEKTASSARCALCPSSVTQTLKVLFACEHFGLTRFETTYLHSFSFIRISGHECSSVVKLCGIFCAFCAFLWPFLLGASAAAAPR
jgi:hypothetical protein